MTLDEELDRDPLAMLVRWHAEARARGESEPDAMTLATATLDGRPAARIVLYKGVVAGKIQFATNYASRKGREIDRNPAVALVFHWIGSQRQVRIEGSAGRAASAESDRYFQSRPRESQLAAWASEQSEPVESRAVLEARYAAALERFAGKSVERPPHWGLYEVTPESVEFWSSRPHRLHDRVLFTESGSGWRRVLLFP
jgi:pyridoxamine 5'-phosphate oxidase